MQLTITLKIKKFNNNQKKKIKIMKTENIYTEAKKIAINLKKYGYGKTESIRNYYLYIFSRIELEELTQIVAIAIFLSNKTDKSVYHYILKILAFCGYYKNTRKHKVDYVELNDNLIVYDNEINYYENEKFRELERKYNELGFNKFYEYYFPDCREGKEKIRKLTWKCFAKRRINKKLI